MKNPKKKEINKNKSITDKPISSAEESDETASS